MSVQRTTTIYHELTRPNPQVVNHNVGGANTRAARIVESWTEWKDFNAATLYDMFHDIIQASWTVRVSLHAPSTPWDSHIHDEDEFEHYLASKHIVPAVNAALAFASSYTKMDVDLHLGRSGKTRSDVVADNRNHADWALCREDMRSQRFPDKYISLMPGDSKMSTKWLSSDYTVAPNNWADPVNQVAIYSQTAPSRYGFIITDTELVVLRFRAESVNEAGLSGGRSRRQPAPAKSTTMAHAAHARQLSTATVDTVLSDSVRSMSIADSSGSYAPSVMFADVCEYRAIPWEACADSSGPSSHKGKGKVAPVLTVRLALFYLCWMAGCGWITPQENYPPLDSYWQWDSTMPFIHNSMGIVYKSKGQPKRIHHPNPQVGGADSQAGGEGEGTCLTRAVALTLEVVKLDNGSRVYKYVTDEGASHLVTPEVPVLDTETNVLGHFVNLVWQAGEYMPPPSSSRGKHAHNPSRSSGGPFKKRH
ncbi:hypothetical protein SCUCBS95973_004890 [Sporothrix curviconia]|uniref:Uncharacterized protein n=1 Tax=Sporothrix curviconia TaxID=1260050 RepID=A0ABP0BS83_9PEZI